MRISTVFTANETNVLSLRVTISVINDKIHVNCLTVCDYGTRWFLKVNGFNYLLNRRLSVTIFNMFVFFPRTSAHCSIYHRTWHKVSLGRGKSLGQSLLQRLYVNDDIFNTVHLRWFVSSLVEIALDLKKTQIFFRNYPITSPLGVRCTFYLSKLKISYIQINMYWEMLWTNMYALETTNMNLFGTVHVDLRFGIVFWKVPSCFSIIIPEE